MGFSNLKTGYSFTVIHLDLSFWIQRLVQIACGGRYGFYPNNIQGHLRRFGIYLDPKNVQVPNTEPQEGYLPGCLYRLFQSSRDLPGPTPGFEKDYYGSKETLPSHVQKLSCGGNLDPVQVRLAVGSQEFWREATILLENSGTMETIVCCILV